MGTLTVCGLADGEETWKVTHTGRVTMTPPTKPVNRCPHTGSRTCLREAATRARPEEVRADGPYTSVAPAGRIMETVA